MDFVCPKCKGEFTVLDNGVKRCPLGHSFDRAKEGYYNLLIGGSAGTHGDNKEMVLARRAFLEKGHYLPLLRAVTSSVLAVTDKGYTLLDSGCGEGYYTAAVEKALFEKHGKTDMLAYDISKDAVKRAAKLCPRVSFSVASSYSLPLLDGSVDTVFNIFSPLAIDEIKRVLRSGGHFIIAYPAERHLFGLKAVLYDNPYENKPENTALDGFTLVEEKKVDYTATLRTADEIHNLFMMTPYAYRTPKEGRERLSRLDTLSTELSFRVITYKKN